MKAKRLNYKAALRRLVTMYSEKHNLAGVLKTVNELESVGSEMSNSILYAMLKVAASVTDTQSDDLKNLESRL